MLCLIFKNLSILKIFIQIFGIFDSLCPNFDFMYDNFALFCTNYSFPPMLCSSQLESRQNVYPLLFPKFCISIGILPKCLPPVVSQISYFYWKPTKMFATWNNNQSSYLPPYSQQLFNYKFVFLFKPKALPPEIVSYHLISLHSWLVTMTLNIFSSIWVTEYIL